MSVALTGKGEFAHSCEKSNDNNQEGLTQTSTSYIAAVWTGAHKKILAFLHICKDICPLIQENLLKFFFGFKKVLKKCWEVWGLNLQSLDYSK